MPWLLSNWPSTNESYVRNMDVHSLRTCLLLRYSNERMEDLAGLVDELNIVKGVCGFARRDE